MLMPGPAKKVTIFVNEDSHHKRMALHDSIMNALMEAGVNGATAMRALSGFGAHHTMHTPRIELLAEHLPVIIEFVESAAKVEEVLPKLEELLTDGLIEVQDTVVVKHARK